MALMSVILPKHDAAVEVVHAGVLVAPVKSTEPMRGMSWATMALTAGNELASKYAVSCANGTLDDVISFKLNVSIVNACPAVSVDVILNDVMEAAAYRYVVWVPAVTSIGVLALVKVLVTTAVGDPDTALIVYVNIYDFDTVAGLAKVATA